MEWLNFLLESSLLKSMIAWLAVVYLAVLLKGAFDVWVIKKCPDHA